MRGADEQTGALFSYLSPEAMVPKDHPLRAIRPLVNAALARLSPAFARLYAPTGRVSIAPEKLLRALLLQAFYSVRSERQSNETHASTTVPDARLYRKARGQASKLCYMGHLLMDYCFSVTANTE